MEIEELENTIKKMTLDLEEMKIIKKNHDDSKADLNEFIETIEKAARLCEHVAYYDKSTGVLKQLNNEATANRIRKYKNKAVNKLNQLNDQK